MTTTTTPVLDLAALDQAMIDDVGGKAAGLGELIRSGEHVPPGFCLTTAAYRSGEIPTEAVLAAYRELGGGAVAVRSSATAEDLPDASFAGQQETVLDVSGEEELLAAVRTCWDSLHTERAVAYREAHLPPDQVAEMAVVVQRMVPAVVAGVLFTANPITGTRDQTVVNAAWGSGAAVVDGSVAADQYVVDDEVPSNPDGCLTRDQLEELCRAGRRVQERSGQPEDLEWAIDADDTLWLLQARPITTLFPLPETDAPPPRVYFEVGHMQGMLRPLTPMGMSLLMATVAVFMGSNEAQIRGGMFGTVDIAGRLFLDLTPSVRDKSIRKRLPESFEIYGPSAQAALERVLEDPRFAPVQGTIIRPGAIARVALRHGPRLVGRVVRSLVRPASVPRQLDRLGEEVSATGASLDDGASAAERVRRAVELQEDFMRGPMQQLMGPLIAGLGVRQLAVALLDGVAEPGEIDATQGGMPHNNTTEMDLALWQVAVRARPHRELLQQTDPAVLADLYLAGELPDIGLDEFLATYGRRGGAEIDIGVPRWREDPTSLFAALAGYLDVHEPDQAPDRRFARAAAQAQMTIATLQARARRTRPLRAALAGHLLRRSRLLAGFRELPKFLWLHALDEGRKSLLAAGAELVQHGLLDRPEDIMFLDLTEAENLARDGGEVFDRVSRRRAQHEREQRRPSVPAMMLSDGTIPTALAPTTPNADGALVGMAASAGTTTGRARVVRDPRGARIEPGEILVAPTTDPGWTPLFMTAGGLVTETGSPMAHGPTVAREYGIPAVICLPEATTIIRTGQLITVDGAAGTVHIEEPD
ncbi:MAG: PEP/pyruvate-binding domain-containing protein [Propionibacteriaceae bacterium]